MLLVPAVKSYRGALNHVFAPAGTNLAANRISCRVFSSFERNCLPGEIKPSEWNLSLVLRSLTCQPQEPLKLSSYKDLNWKTCCLLGLFSAKRVRVA